MEPPSLPRGPKHARLPNASFEGRFPFFTLRQADWESAQKSYECVIPPAVRKKVRKATKDYIEEATFEQRAALMETAQRKLSEVRRGATRFESELKNHLSKSDDSSSYARSLLIKHLRFEMPPVCGDEPSDESLSALFADDPLPFVLGAAATNSAGLDFRKISNFIFACDESLKEARDATGYKSGASWHIWIRRLAKILVEQGLPVAAYANSPFVSLVEALQSRLPEAYRRRVHSRSAFAKAIERARRARLDK